MDTIALDVAGRIKHVMEEKSLKQADLCKITGLTRNSMSTYVLGKHLPDTMSLYKIAQALQVTVEWLLSGYTTIQDIPLSYDEISLVNKMRNGGIPQFIFDSSTVDGDAGRLNDKENRLIIKYRELTEDAQQDISDFVDLKYARKIKEARSLLFQNGNESMESDRLA